eukprot:CFRG5994T1
MTLLISKRAGSIPSEFRGSADHCHRSNTSPVRWLREWIYVRIYHLRRNPRAVLATLACAAVYLYVRDPATDLCMDVWSEKCFDTITIPLTSTSVQSAVRTDAPESKCPDYSPGLLPVTDINGRSFCFGGTSLPGQRVCDRFWPDFGQPFAPGKEWLGVKVRDQAFLIHPWLHTSLNTQRNRAYNTNVKSSKNDNKRENLYTESAQITLPSSSQITLATQGSFNRVGYLNPLARRWQGPISLTLLLESKDQLADVKDIIRQDALLQLWVDIHVVIRLPKAKSARAQCGSKLPDDYIEAVKAFGLDEYLPHLTMAGGQFLYKCYSTCVAYGKPIAHCYKEFNICGGKEEYGTTQQQVETLKVALEHTNHTHPECPMKDNHYPVNMLRNVAQHNIETGWVMPLDIDVIPSSCMAYYVQSAKKAEEYIQSQPLPDKGESSTCPGLYAFIPPAIEMSLESLNSLNRVLENPNGNPQQTCETIPKSEAVRALYSGAATPMHAYFHAAYVPTNHVKWMKSDANTFFEVPYTIRFEPYYITRSPIPMFNPGFVDRGGNFAQQVLEMYSAGYRFFVIPDAFLVDIPHTQQGPRQTEDNHKLSNALWKSFYRFVPTRYGLLDLPPYKGPEYRNMREFLAEMAEDFFRETNRLEEFKARPQH